MKRFTMFLMLLAAIALTVGCKPALGVLDVGQKIGKFPLKDAQGKKVDMAAMKKVSVVAFWMPGDPESRRSLDNLAAALKKSTLKGIPVLAVTRGKDKAEQSGAKKDFAKYKWPFRLVFDPGLEAATSFGVTQPLPVYYIIGADGTLKSPAVRKANGLIRGATFATLLEAVAAGRLVPRVDFLEVEPSDEGTLDLIGKKPPAFTAKDLRGQAFSPWQFKGTASLILLFWSPTCPHCHREIPRIKAFIAKYGSKYKVKVASVVGGDGKEFRGQIEGAVTDLMVDFPVMMTSSKSIIRNYKAERVPMVYVINKNGVVCEVLSGEHEDSVQILKSIFDDPRRMGLK